MITPDQVLPAGWRQLIVPGLRTVIGYDPATTEKETSNPSGIAIAQEQGRDIIVRAGAIWKTKDPAIARAVIAAAMDMPHGIRPHAFVIDASNERYFATDLKTAYQGKTNVIHYVATENVMHGGVDMPMKTFAGNLCKNALEDGRLILPNEEWVYKNFRGVKEEKGRFVFELDEDGNHCDFVQAVWNCLVGLTMPGSGPVSASAIGPGTISWLQPGASVHGRGLYSSPSPRFS